MSIFLHLLTNSMSSKKFYQLLALTSILTIVLLVSLPYVFPPLQSYLDLGWISLFLFMAITVMMFLMGQSALKSTNKMQFSNVGLGFILLKMMLSIMIIVLYKKIAHPVSNAFIAPFFIVYFIFTIFETYLMLRMARK